jgi:cell wall assembly regulator SMI1
MEVDESLHRITAWCNRHAPATAAAIRPPASADVLSTVQATTGRRWPDDLVAFYGSCDGTERTPAGYLFPGYCPDPLSDVGRHWTRWQTFGRASSLRSRTMKPTKKNGASGGLSAQDP